MPNGLIAALLSSVVIVGSANAAWAASIAAPAPSTSMSKQPLLCRQPVPPASSRLRGPMERPAYRGCRHRGNFLGDALIDRWRRYRPGYEYDDVAVALPVSCRASSSCFSTWRASFARSQCPRCSSFSKRAFCLATRSSRSLSKRAASAVSCTRIILSPCDQRPKSTNLGLCFEVTEGLRIKQH